MEDKKVTKLVFDYVNKIDEKFLDNLTYTEAKVEKEKYLKECVGEILKSCKDSLLGKIKLKKLIKEELDNYLFVKPERFKLVYGFDDDFPGDDDYYIYSIECLLQKNGTYNMIFESLSGEKVTLNPQGKVVASYLQKEYSGENQFVTFVKNLFNEGYTSDWALKEFDGVKDGYKTIQFAFGIAKPETEVTNNVSI